MIGNKLYQRRTEAWFRGKRVRTLRELRNGYTVIPKGAVLTITRKSSGFLLEGDPCEHCGVRIRISKVSPCEVELVERLIHSNESCRLLASSGCCTLCAEITCTAICRTLGEYDADED